MTSRFKTVFVAALLVVPAGIAVCGATGCSGKKPAVRGGTDAAPRAEPVVVDAPLAPFRARLLEVAFEAASAMPADPHIKDRSRAQESVVEACLDLGQVRRALGYADQIRDWRRGSAYARLACHAVELDRVAPVGRWLDLASNIADERAREEGSQDWEVGTIRAGVARARSLANGTAAASRPGFEEDLRRFDGIAETADVQGVELALDDLLAVYDREFSDPARRTRILATIGAVSAKQPLVPKVDLLVRMSEAATRHAARADALAALDEALTVVQANQWLPEDRAAIQARIASARFRAGDAERARSLLGAASVRFDSEIEGVADVFRARALRALAEAYQEIGEREAALRSYRRAVEAAVLNPNSRPRAEDLSAICRSMAVHAAEPDPALFARIESIRAGLGPPW